MAIIFIRTIVLFLSVTLSMRIMGKRQLGQLELSELVVAVLISDLASHPIQDIGIPLMNGLLPVIILLLCELIIAGLIVRSHKIRRILCGKPSILISNGQIMQSEMKKNRFAIDELTEELRKKNITDFSKVKYAILETDGILNTILYPSEQPLTPAHMNIETEDPGYTTILINDGKVVEENLGIMGKDMAWLQNELRKRGFDGAEDVFILTVNHSDQIYYAKMEENKKWQKKS